MYTGVETGNIIAAIATVMTWGISFGSIHKYIKSHWTGEDNGFYMVFTVLASMAVAIATATLAVNIQKVPTATLDSGLLTPAVMATALAVVIMGAATFVGLNRYAKSHWTGEDNGFYMVFTVLASMAVAIGFAIIALDIQKSPAAVDSVLFTPANIIAALAAVVIGTASFVGINRYIKSHWTGEDNGFYMIFTVLASIAAAITTATVAEGIMKAQPGAVDAGLFTPANIATALAVVMIGAGTFVGMNRYVKPRQAQYDNGFYAVFTVLASMAMAIAAATVAVNIQRMTPTAFEMGRGITAVDIGLAIVAFAVLIGPFTVKKIEHNLELFLFIMGVLAVTVAGVWDLKLVEEAITEPVVKGIVPAVLFAGMLFHYGRTHAQSAMASILENVPIKLVVFVMIVGLGLASSIITAIIASLLLVELVNCMPLERKTKINVAIIACFSIGLGAVLTPLGEPLSTIAIAKLQGPPYHASFFFLFDNLGGYVIPGVLAMGLLGVLFTGKSAADQCIKAVEDRETLRDVVMRAGKVYVFVMALLLLGGGMKILIDKYLLTVPSQVLFWVNMLSAILDNATLTAAEIAPSMSISQITAALIGLLIAGGMLIPGNIPNIISANKLGITSKEWARLGIPLGLILMVGYYVWFFYIPFKPSLSL